MDGTTAEHSDSDSGESWTLLENTSTCPNDIPGLSDSLAKRDREAAENNDKDEDTDGISIISDSDPESITPCENYEKCLLGEENRPTEPQIPQFVSITPLSPNINNNHNESIRSEDPFLIDNTGKLKTYVHRRNKRLSTVLNIIVLGSVITAVGVAIGHMWGARDDCSMHTVPSVNKILSNLYKLQEENSYLRNIIKELTLINNVQMQQRKSDSEKLPYKQHRCKKVFEESLNNKNADKLTKCVESETVNVRNYMIEPEYEKDFITDVNKLKNMYEQNKSWLDEEIAKRLKTEEESVERIKNKVKSSKSNKVNILKDENLKKQTENIIEEQMNKETIENETESIQKPKCLLSFKSESSKCSENKSLYLKSTSSSKEDRKIEKSEIQHHDTFLYEHKEPNLSDHWKEKPSYANSLKLDKDGLNKRTNINENNVPESKIKEYIRKKKLKKDYDTISENSVSEEELKKDDRYSGPKHKQERKKHDRQKLHKKQKRKNKYEQWEMKGGYMKDYDDISATSSQENDYGTLTDMNKKNIDSFSETDDNVKFKPKLKSENHIKHDKNSGKSNKKEKDLNWYEKRAVFRKEARQKLEQELFGDTTNNAGWYFRRMQRREQCRAKRDNSTYRKLSKRNMNFKMKH